MHTANYRTATNGAGEVGQYPLSTETLEFIQDQIRQLHDLSMITGYHRPWVLSTPLDSEEGLLLYGNELITIEKLTFSLNEGETYGIYLRERKEDIRTPDDTYKGARTYRTVYIAPKGANGAIGEVIATGDDKVETLDLYTLAQLAKMAKSREIWSLAVSDKILTSTDIKPNWLGRHILIDASRKEPNVMMSPQELDQAYLTTLLLDDSTESFMQDLETSEGVRYRRIFNSPNDVDDHGLDKFPDIDKFDWVCLPNQVVGSCRITINPDASKSSITLTRGILSGANLTAQGSGFLISTDRLHKMLQPGKSRVELSLFHRGYGTLHTIDTSIDLVPPYGKSISIGVDPTRLHSPEDVLLSVISL